MQIYTAKMRELNWNDLRYILAISRSTSLAMASRKLGVNESTVARRLSGVESLLNAKLFEKSVKGIIPTDAGIIAMYAAERFELGAQELVDRISGADQRISGNVRLTAVPMILNRFLVPAMPQLISEYPHLGMELVAESRDLSLTKRDADIAIRLSRPTSESRIITRRVGSLHYAVYSSRSKKKRSSLPWINYEEGMSHLPQSQWIFKQIRKSGCVSQVRVNDAESILMCLKNGIGQSLLPTFVGDSEKEIDRVSGEIVLTREIWMLVHPDLKELGHVRKVMDWLIILFEKL